MILAGKTFAVNAPSYPVTGTAPKGTLVKVYRDANANKKKDAGDVLVGQKQLTSSTVFTVTATLSQDATNRLIVTSTQDGVESKAVLGPTEDPGHARRQRSFPHRTCLWLIWPISMPVASRTRSGT